METRRLGSRGFDVPVVGMGTWQTFDVARATAVQPVVDVALAERAAFFDSSPMYGRAERVLAEALGARRREALVATKVWTPSAREGREQIRRALEWYGGTVDLYQIHNLEAWAEHLPYLEELKAAGRIRAIGITHYSPSRLDELAEIMTSGRVDAVQVPYNPGERTIERAVLPLAERLAIGVILMRPLGQGALARRAPPARDLGFLRDAGLTTWAQALLNWGLSDPRVTVTIPATASASHAADNCRVGAAPRFDAEVRARVAALAGRVR
jgi:aryl-alcohol dehydrogenase-like predicted oxidoreductase